MKAREHRTARGETWDMIAKKELGSEYLMTELMKANRDKMKIRVFEGGEILVIPPAKEAAIKTARPPWSGK